MSKLGNGDYKPAEKAESETEEQTLLLRHMLCIVH
jgi:hypothetical protein